MKKLSAIIIAMALVLGLSQCKKQETPTANNEEDMVYITVNVDDDGAKHTVYPNHGLYGFDNGDLLYVGNNGHYIGTLEYQSGAFSGGIQSPSTDDYLHFYFLGGKGPQAPEAGTESFTIDIADQSGELPVLSYGHSTQKYTDANATYSTTLRNKCALVEFATNEIPVETFVSISGMKTEATINFSDNTIAPNGTTGDLTLHAESTSSHWAILLPGEEVATTASAVGYNSIDITVPSVDINNFLHGESAINFEMTPTLQGTPLTMEALTDGTIVVWQPQDGMQYSLNGGEKTGIWGHSYDSYTINVTAGDKVQFYGDGTNITTYSSMYGMTHLGGGTATVKVYGNIMSLVDETSFATATTLEASAFYGLFQGMGYFASNSTLVDASGLLLPATTLSASCYAYMFYGCNNLAAAPAELPATTLAMECYFCMFCSCTSLTTVPVLPATTLAMYCYNSMFADCTSLTTAPVLPATELDDYCYSNMFNGCSNLSSVTCLATEGMGYGTENWLEGAGANVTGTKTFYAAPAAEWSESNSGIPSGWTRVNIQ